MKALARKWIIIPVALTVLVLPVILLFSIYFSQDAKQILTEYPVRNLKLSHAPVDFKKTRPKHWVSLSAISRYVQYSIIFSEDWSFYQHDGFDWNQMKSAFGEAANGKRMRGASTITQQLVKNIWLTEDRTFWRKFNEFILAYKVDRDIPKKKILETYLNIIEFGPGLYGIGPASKYYFGKSPSDLSPRESSFLAMLLPSPKRYAISYKKKKLSAFAKKRVDQILDKLRMGKVITMEQYHSEINSHFNWE